MRPHLELSAKLYPRNRPQQSEYAVSTLRVSIPTFLFPGASICECTSQSCEPLRRYGGRGGTLHSSECGEAAKSTSWPENLSAGPERRQQSRATFSSWAQSRSVSTCCLMHCRGGESERQHPHGSIREAPRRLGSRLGRLLSYACGSLRLCCGILRLTGCVAVYEQTSPRSRKSEREVGSSRIQLHPREHVIATQPNIFRRHDI